MEQEKEKVTRADYDGEAGELRFLRDHSAWTRSSCWDLMCTDACVLSPCVCTRTAVPKKGKKEIQPKESFLFASMFHLRLPTLYPVAVCRRYLSPSGGGRGIGEQMGA